MVARAEDIRHVSTPERGGLVYCGYSSTPGREIFERAHVAAQRAWLEPRHRIDDDGRPELSPRR